MDEGLLDTDRDGIANCVDSDDMDSDGIPNDFEDEFGGLGITIDNPVTGNIASVTGSQTGGSRITSGDIAMVLPAGAASLGVDEITIRD